MENHPRSGTVSVPDSAQRIATKATKVTSARKPPTTSVKGMRNEQVNVFSYALVGIVRFMRHELHPIVSAIGQPSAKIALGKPAPPADLEHLAQIKLVDSEKKIRTISQDRPISCWKNSAWFLSCRAV
jgi:hypothetical protein